MKSVLISIQPKWCELIASGKKTVEVRKTRPKIETPFKCYIYCTNNKRQYLRKLGTSCQEIFITENRDVLGRTEKVKSLIGDTSTFWEQGGYNGKVIGEFVCDDFTYIEAGYDTNGNKHLYNTAFIEHRMCIPDLELFEYLYKSREKCGGWAWHINDLVIYDKPKELSEFKHWKKFDWWDYGHHKNKPQWELRSLSRPPQSWCYVEEAEKALGGVQG